MEARHHPHTRPSALGTTLNLLAVTLLASAALIGMPASTFGGTAPADQSTTGTAAALQSKHNELIDALRHSALGTRVVLRSSEGESQVEGDVYAEVEHPFDQVSSAFRGPGAICEILVLHLNVRACGASTGSPAQVLTLLIGPKRAASPGAVYSMSYAVTTDALDSKHLRVSMQAKQGPLSTSDYRIVFEAVPLEDGHSFLHLGYSYRFGLLAQMAMKAYLATAGRDKIGFTVTGREADGRPIYLRGERAALERNAMRYYLALLAYCETSAVPLAQREDARLRDWFALTERYSAQLHELDLKEYLREKQDDRVRTSPGETPRKSTGVSPAWRQPAAWGSAR